MRKFTTIINKNRITLLKWFIVACSAIVVVRLFQIQVVDYQIYESFAKDRVKNKIIPARRGSILLNEKEPGKYFELVSNVSLDLLYADPMLLENPEDTAKKIAPILLESAKNQNKACGGSEECLNTKLETQLISTAVQTGAPDLGTGSLTETDILGRFTEELAKKLGKKERDFVILKGDLLKEKLTTIQELKLDGIFTTSNYVYANPLLVSSPKAEANALSTVLDMPEDVLEYSLTRRPNRYVRIQNKIDFEAAEKIRALEIKGLGFVKEHWRNYTEQDGNNFFAPQVIGFIDHAFNPVYGIEKSMDELLRGKQGVIRGDVDISGRTLTGRSNTIEEAQNGSSIVLTIDHVIQDTIDGLLKQQVIESQAVSGEVVIQDPMTGKILAMATYPGFNPNKFGDVYEKEEIYPTEEEKKNIVEKKSSDGSKYYLYSNPGNFIEIFKQDDKWFAYKNRVGVRAYRNPIVSDIYEPGSVFKAIAMAAAIDAREVTPNTTFNDVGPVVVDNGDFTIHNSTGKYHGTVDMTTVLVYSLNTGMTFVARKIGPATFYEYLKNFGFGERTNIELPDEEKGRLSYFRQWVSESDLVTKAFGQGVAATPLQVVNALSAIANGGKLMQPYIVDATIATDGTVTKTEPQVIRRVITEDSSKIMSAMLARVLEESGARLLKIDSYRIAGKTGTSQIATNGLYEKGDGSTIASLGGFGPISDPKFTILVKINRPRHSPWGETNAGPLFRKIVDYLVDYYHIPPDYPPTFKK